MESSLSPKAGQADGGRGMSQIIGSRSRYLSRVQQWLNQQASEESIFSGQACKWQSLQMRRHCAWKRAVHSRQEYHQGTIVRTRKEQKCSHQESCDKKLIERNAPLPSESANHHSKWGMSVNLEKEKKRTSLIIRTLLSLKCSPLALVAKISLILC